MDVSDIIKEAWAAVQKAELPKEIEVSAFSAAVQLLSMTHGNESGGEGPQSLLPKETKSTAKVIGKSESTKSDTTPVSKSSDITEDEMLDRIVAHTKVDKKKLERLVQLEGSEPRLIQSSLKGDLSTAAYIRAIALVLTVVRDAGLNEKVTPVSVIKAECSRLKKLDEANFAQRVATVENTVLKGENKTRALKARTDAFADFPQVVNRLLGIREDQ